MNRRHALTVAAGLIAAPAVAVRAAAAPADAGSVTTVGFLYDGGRYRTILVPGTVTETFAASVNNRGQIAGGFDLDAARSFHGIVRDRHGRITRIDVPGAAGTSITKINNRGDVVGVFSDANPDPQAAGDTRGFSFDGRRFTRLAVPGAVKTQAFGLSN